MEIVRSNLAKNRGAQGNPHEDLDYDERQEALQPGNAQQRHGNGDNDKRLQQKHRASGHGSATSPCFQNAPCLVRTRRIVSKMIFRSSVTLRVRTYSKSSAKVSPQLSSPRPLV